MNMKTTLPLLLTIAMLAIVSRTIADVPVGTAFTYQGRFKQNGALITGRADFQFKLFNALSGGTQIGSTQTILADPLPTINNIDKGLFNVMLDFGSNAFDGSGRWLEIAVRYPAGGGSYVSVSPRQALSPAPYSISGGGWSQLDGDTCFLGGNVGIGMQTPDAQLQLRGGGSPAHLRIEQTGLPGATTDIRDAGLALRINKLTTAITSSISLSPTPGAVPGNAAYINFFDFTVAEAAKLRVFRGDGISNNVVAQISATAQQPTFFQADGGNVGIGTFNPTANLDISAAVAASFLLRSSGDDATMTLQSPSNGGSRIIFDNSGPKWEVGTSVFGNLFFNDLVHHTARVLFGLGTSPAVQVYGSACADGGFATCSDARLKKDVGDIPEALSIVDQLHGVHFNWRCDEFPQRGFDKARQIGFIAQEVQPLLPEIVMQGDDGYLSIDYSRFTPVLVEAVKELHAQANDKDARLSQQQNVIEVQQRELAEQRFQIEHLAARVEAVEARLARQDHENENEVHKTGRHR